MNKGHAELCSSPEWAEHIAVTVLPAAVGALDLGAEVLEIGPGYGASTRVLVDAVPDLTAVEVDESLARELESAYPSVTVVTGSGDDLPFEDDRFTAVVCFTMLHHVHTRQMQDALFAQARRVLRPGVCSPGRTASRARGFATSTATTSTSRWTRTTFPAASRPPGSPTCR